MSPATPFSARSLSRGDDRHAQLAGLYANRGEDGVDTFGNTGTLRCVLFCYTEARCNADNIMQVWSYRHRTSRCHEDGNGQ
jgi:hypothetical protein